MIKNILILFFLMIFLVPNAANAQKVEQDQQRKNSIAINLLPFYNYTAEINYQRQFQDKHGLYLALSTTFRKNFFRKYGYSYEFQYRYGFDNKQKIEYYIGPFYKYQYLEAFQVVHIAPFYTNRLSQESFAETKFVGVILGTNYDFTDNFYIEIYSGIGIKFSQYYSNSELWQTTLDYIGYKNGPDFNLGVNMGLKF